MCMCLRYVPNAKPLNLNYNEDPLYIQENWKKNKCPSHLKTFYSKFQQHQLDIDEIELLGPAMEKWSASVIATHINLNIKHNQF